MNGKMTLTIAWVKAHGFNYKVVDNTVFWQTNVNTAKYDSITDTIEWYSADYFETI